MEKMDEEIRHLLSELKEQLILLYGDRLKGVYLFGSCARDEADQESDVDILIVLDHVENYSREIDSTSAIIAALSLRFGRSISRVFTSEERWKTEGTIFFQNAREEAISV